MGSVFKSVELFGPAGFVLRAILGSLLGIVFLVDFIAIRRWYRGRYFKRRSERSLAVRARWEDIVSGKISPADWRFHRMDCELVESALLDQIEMSTPETLPPLLHCLRASGLLDVRIHEARTARGWKQRAALLTLGRTRAKEAIPALAAGLESERSETRIAAVRALGRTGIVEAALPILERILEGKLDAPERSLKNSLTNCCRTCPAVLIGYLEQSRGAARELLARVLAELASPDLSEELLVLAADPLPEVRASAARALGRTNTASTLPALHSLATDSEWFVRLRAVVALGQVKNPGKIRFLIRALCDPNRHVRQRAAWALAQSEPQLEEILEGVIATKDRYALEAFISELERAGEMETLFRALRTSDHAAHTNLRQIVERARTSVEQSGKAAAASAGGR
jgi:HEAT repeat protein